MTYRTDIAVALEKVNAALAIHSGHCEVVAVDGGTVVVQLTGGCAGCPSSQATLYGIVGPIMEEEISWLDTVLLDLGSTAPSYDRGGVRT